LFFEPAFGFGFGALAGGLAFRRGRCDGRALAQGFEELAGIPFGFRS
jgi:hypothetical protein